ncbi:unspecific monooxygenase [Saccharopolyspora erythraea NRRL 2338]|uniref:Cytochrome P450 n=2 Tax=Saccharopolyspora erythraea TaxID=1836 RepID=A4FKH3_SACEN|nr:cytochrome P450 [Saccharopolyspora erythraea]PFG98186.1 unspecific monooxygenase [Saccharopolyspora erythraea NRRL 2338]QRK88286.1 cytochrome P450 [Saccharopolyspora erythraea]CAM04548.1 putative cytochrome P450 [Saccharopolyspora erythraea NRRL 2338]
MTAGTNNAGRLGALAEAVLGYNPVDPEYHANAHEHHRRMAERGPIFRTPGGMWTAVSHAACSAVLRDDRFGHDPGSAAQNLFDSTQRPSVAQRSFEFMDGPDHSRLRRLVNRAFTARRVERLRPAVRTLADQLLTDVSGRIDVLADFILPLAMTTIVDMLGAPTEDNHLFRAWAEPIVRGLDPDFLLSSSELAAREQANAEFAEYFDRLVALRRAEPKDDLISALIAVEDDGVVLSGNELISMCLLLLAAGHESIMHLVGNGTVALLRDEDQLEHFRGHPGEVTNAVNELLRYDPPVVLLVRTALADAEVLGNRVRRGEIVWLQIGAANRDPAVFPDPDRLDLTRDTGGSLAFGLGIHFCIGASLARLEAAAALSALLHRDVALASEQLVHQKNVVIRGYEEVPVVLR